MRFFGLAVLVAAGLFVAGWLFQPGNEPATSCRMTLTAFNSLHATMSYAQAVSVIGCEGTVTSQSDLAGYSDVLYSWAGTGSAGANANAIFQNGALVSKAQVGLH